jgi:hypothetical protein
MSPFSAAAALGAGGLGLIQAQKFDANGNPISGSSLWNQVLNSLGNIGNTGNTGSTGGTGGTGSTDTSGWNFGDDTGGDFGTGGTGGTDTSNWNFGEDTGGTGACGFASGGRIQPKAIGGMVGGLSCQVMGGMPPSCSGMNCNAGNICTPYMAKGGIARGMLAGRVGCASTQYRGGLPYKG